VSRNQGSDTHFQSTVVNFKKKWFCIDWFSNDCPACFRYTKSCLHR